MKKITFYFLLLLVIAGARAQCINANQFPGMVVNSNNLGTIQEISTCNYTSEYAAITNLVVGTDYIFTCTSSEGNVHKYITITNASNEVITSGPSPLTVTAIPEATIRAHYTENESCSTVNLCHITTIQAVLACPIPTDIISTAIGTTTASFSWTPGGTEAAWEVLVFSSLDDAPTNNDSGVAVTSANYSATDLAINTSYSFYVRANCDGSFSPWSLPLDFTTNCISTDFINENFDAELTGNLPDCWTTVLRGPNLGFAGISTITWNSTSSAPTSVRLGNSNANSTTSDIILVSPALVNAGAGTHRVKFFAKGTANLQVGTLDNNSSVGVFTEVQAIDITETMTQYTVEFSSVTNTDQFIAFRMNPTSTFQDVFLDNVIWEQIPSCPDVIELAAADVDENSISISWTSQGSETAWQGVISTSATTNPAQLTAVNFDSTSGTFENLPENTQHFIWIRSFCSATELGAWIGPIAVRTNCIPVPFFSENFDASQSIPSCWTPIRRGTNLSEFSTISINSFQTVGSAPNSVELYNSTSQTNNGADIMLLSPALSNLGAGTNRVKFRASGAGSIDVGTTDTNLPTANFTLLEGVTLQTGTNDYVVDFNAYSGTDRHIAFRMNNPITFSFTYIDDVIWEVTPSCSDVTNVEVPNVTTTTASLTWVSQGIESEWQYVVGAPNIINPNDLTPVNSTSTDATIENLNPNTSYKVWVRSFCSAADLGAWIGPVNFETACEAIALFSEDFDSVTTPNIPDCWSEIIRGATVSPFASIGSNGFVDTSSSPNAIELYNSDSNTTTNDVILVSPNLSTLGSDLYRVKFVAFGTGNLQIVTLDSNTANATFTVVGDVTVTDEVEEYTVLFNTSTTDTYFGFRMNNAGIFQSIFIDDVRYELAPTCPDVSDIDETNTDTTSISIEWAAGDSESNWQYAVTTVPDSNLNTLVAGPVLNETFATIENLEPATTYYIYVRSVCPANDFGAWIGPIKVNTECVPEDYAETELDTFENTEEDELPTCWSAELISGDDAWTGYTPPMFADITTTVSGSRIVYKNYPTSTSLLFSRPYDFSTVTGSSQINLWLHRHQLAHVTDKYNIYVNTDASLEGAELVFEQFSKTTAEPAVDATGFYNYQIAIPESFNGAEIVYVIIEGITTAGFQSYALGVDDFKVEAAPLGIEAPIANVFKMAPNPVTDVLQISATKSMENVTVFNLIGQVVSSKELNSSSTTLDLSTLPSGTYLVKITADGKAQTQKVIKR